MRGFRRGYTTNRGKEDDETPFAARQRPQQRRKRKKATDILHGIGSPEGMELTGPGDTTVPQPTQPQQLQQPAQPQQLRPWQKRPETSHLAALADTASPDSMPPTPAGTSTGSSGFASSPISPSSFLQSPAAGRPTPPDASNPIFAAHFERQQNSPMALRGTPPRQRRQRPQDRRSESNNPTAISFDSTTSAASPGLARQVVRTARVARSRLTGTMATPSPTSQRIVIDPPNVVRRHPNNANMWNASGTTNAPSTPASPGPPYPLGGIDPVFMGMPRASSNPPMTTTTAFFDNDTTSGTSTTTTSNTVSPDRDIFGTPSRWPDGFSTPLIRPPQGYESTDDESENSVKERLSSHVKSLDDLLLSTGKRLGRLAYTSPDRGLNDSMEREEQELEDIRRQLRKELSQVDFTVLEETPVAGRRKEVSKSRNRPLFFNDDDDDDDDDESEAESSILHSAPSPIRQSGSITGTPNQSPGILSPTTIGSTPSRQILPGLPRHPQSGNSSLARTPSRTADTNSGRGQWMSSPGLSPLPSAETPPHFSSSNAYSSSEASSSTASATSSVIAHLMASTRRGRPSPSASFGAFPVPSTQVFSAPIISTDMQGPTSVWQDPNISALGASSFTDSSNASSGRKDRSVHGKSGVVPSDNSTISSKATKSPGRESSTVSALKIGPTDSPDRRSTTPEGQEEPMEQEASPLAEQQNEQSQEESSRKVAPQQEETTIPQASLSPVEPMVTSEKGAPGGGLLSRFGFGRNRKGKSIVSQQPPRDDDDKNEDGDVQSSKSSSKSSKEPSKEGSQAALSTSEKAASEILSFSSDTSSSTEPKVTDGPNALESNTQTGAFPTLGTEDQVETPSSEAEMSTASAHSIGQSELPEATNSFDHEEEDASVQSSKVGSHLLTTEDQSRTFSIASGDVSIHDSSRDESDGDTEANKQDHGQQLKPHVRIKTAYPSQSPKNAFPRTSTVPSIFADTASVTKSAGTPRPKAKVTSTTNLLGSSSPQSPEDSDKLYNLQLSSYSPERQYAPEPPNIVVERNQESGEEITRSSPAEERRSLSPATNKTGVSANSNATRSPRTPILFPQRRFFPSGILYRDDREPEKDLSRTHLLSDNNLRSDTTVHRSPRQTRPSHISAYDQSSILPAMAGTNTSTMSEKSSLGETASLSENEIRRDGAWFLKTIGSSESPPDAFGNSQMAYDGDEDTKLEDEVEIVFEGDYIPPKILSDDIVGSDDEEMQAPIQTTHNSATEKPNPIGSLQTRKKQCCRALLVSFLIATIFLAGLLLGFLLRKEDTFTESPTLSPILPPPLTIEPSTAPMDIPGDPGAVSFETTYTIGIRNGKVELIPSDDYKEDLEESMDRLVLEIFNSFPERRSPMERRLISDILPSSIARFEDIDCPPQSSPTDRCEDVVTSIAFLGAEDSLDEFKIRLEVSIALGRLQGQLQIVNPDSPVTILESVMLPIPTLAPSIVTTSLPTPIPRDSAAPSSSDTMAPSSGPSSTPTAQPTLEPSLSPSFLPTDTFSSSPTAMPSASDVPFITDTVGPSLMPSTIPTSTPSESPQTTSAPSSGTLSPTLSSTLLPSAAPSDGPTMAPTPLPSDTTPSPTIFPPNSGLPTEFDLYSFLASRSFDGGEALLDTLSPQYLAFSWLSRDSFVSFYNEDKLLQRYAMATFFFSTSGPNWFFNDLWLSAVDECLWYSRSSRPSCNGSGQLRYLDLDYNNLNGILPPELGLMSNSLEEVVIRGGPTIFTAGTIPSELGYLTRMTLLVLRDNIISGSLPSELGRWTNLQQLDLSGNSLRGSIPTEYGVFSDLNSIDLSSNQISGLIPTEFGSLQKCQRMALQSNDLSGPIPTEIGSLRRMQSILMGSNRLESIPTQLGQLSFLDTLALQDNSLRGTIPSELSRLIRMIQLDLSTNELSGTIPVQLGNLRNMRNRINLSSNQLTGGIPTELGKLSRLRVLELQDNRLSGTVPAEISGLARVTTIRIDANNFVGTIPIELCSVFNRTFPAFNSDCAEFDDGCPCCTTCCVDGVGCECRYRGTTQEFLCFQQR